jgi:hypothetical protein
VTASRRLDRILAFTEVIRIARPALYIWIYTAINVYDLSVR